MKYLRPLVPWEVIKYGGRHQLALSFDEKVLARAIKKLKDSKDGPIRGAKEEAESYLERIKELFAEDVQAYAQFDKENLKDPEEGIKEIEGLFATYEANRDLKLLFAITDQKEALESVERARAKADLLIMWNQMQKLQNETKVTTEQFTALDKKYKQLRRSFGVILNGKVDHS